jgi:hypothetical protein
MAVEQGIIAGYQAITSEKFKGTADDAVDVLFSSIFFHLDKVIDLNESEKGQRQIGFAQNKTMARSVKAQSELEPDDQSENDSENPDELEQHHKLKALPKLNLRGH